MGTEQYGPILFLCEESVLNASSCWKDRRERVRGWGRGEVPITGTGVQEAGKKTLTLDELQTLPIVVSSDPHNLTYVADEALGFGSDLSHL